MIEHYDRILKALSEIKKDLDKIDHTLQTTIDVYLFGGKLDRKKFIRLYDKHRVLRLENEEQLKKVRALQAKEQAWEKGGFKKCLMKIPFQDQDQDQLQNIWSKIKKCWKKSKKC